MIAEFLGKIALAGLAAHCRPLAKRLSKLALAGYHLGMHDEARKQPQNLMIAAIGGVFLLLCLAAFIGWIVQGPEILLTMAENGMSWCF
ncbi:hypothetical protein LJR098_002898 [Rhizobium sp. LjRoot98]|uniref:hypothetical protein n=1 Tax=unclassified Rhizobium TaxID=2613769 RepID=UPI00071405F9|nr:MULTISPECIES: hypothetical protein [unclassified Rhizobium]KQV28819.1 hypothetical protein ASC96_15715 [Rhizobium sp. Root1204]KQY05306.1 hypothetical protein ASD36_12825 [Rhizobium sp. Root1334]KRC01923.1 hypothetical protein ASE23_10600 [Rhizobium sp. Root73]